MADTDSSAIWGNIGDTPKTRPGNLPMVGQSEGKKDQGTDKGKVYLLDICPKKEYYLLATS